jgi:hypothetical protein
MNYISCSGADRIATFFFVLMVYYFMNIKNRTLIEWILLLFGISGFLFDIQSWFV